MKKIILIKNVTANVKHVLKQELLIHQIVIHVQLDIISFTIKLDYVFQNQKNQKILI